MHVPMSLQEYLQAICRFKTNGILQMRVLLSRVVLLFRRARRRKLGFLYCSSWRKLQRVPASCFCAGIHAGQIVRSRSRVTKSSWKEQTHMLISERPSRCTTRDNGCSRNTSMIATTREQSKNHDDSGWLDFQHGKNQPSTRRGYV